MSVELFNAIVQAVKDVGVPAALAAGLLGIVWKQTCILSGIRDTLENLIVVLLKEKEEVDEAHQLHPQVRQGRAVQPH